MHKPIIINGIGLSFPDKLCFSDFSTQIHFGDRIGIIGRNGCGKSTLLKILNRSFEPTYGDLRGLEGIASGYVPQETSTHDDSDALSGGQKFNKLFSKSLINSPEILLLDEPTNHLDSRNRNSLFKMLNNYYGTVIIASHDVELLDKCVNRLWHIENSDSSEVIGAKVIIFEGKYRDYIRRCQQTRTSILNEISILNKEQKRATQSLMKQQQKVAKSVASGKKKLKNKRWTKSTADLKVMKAQKTQGAKFKEFNGKKIALQSQISDMKVQKVIRPTFSIDTSNSRNGVILSVKDGKVIYKKREVGSIASYAHPKLRLQNINFQLASSERMSILGNNGSGKSTLIKAILNDLRIERYGQWDVPNESDIGYLDQHYSILCENKTVFETISQVVPSWSDSKVRNHLSTFLFYTAQDVKKQVRHLSGGERARLCLAQIAVRTPKLLLLDEITNNLDLETKEHVIQVLREYSGAIIVVSHETMFLKELGINKEIWLD